MQEAARIAIESRERVEQIGRLMGSETEKPKTPEYRSAGEYVIDRWRAGLGMEEARARLELYHRVAAHMTTSRRLGRDPAGSDRRPRRQLRRRRPPPRQRARAAGAARQDMVAAEGHAAHRRRGAVR